MHSSQRSCSWPHQRDIITNGNIGCSKFQRLLFSSSKKLKLDYRFGRKWIHFEFPSFSVGTGNLLTFATRSPEVLWVTLNKDTSEWPTESMSWWIKQRGYTSFLDKHPKSQRKHIQQCIVYKHNFLRSKWTDSCLSRDPWIYFCGRLSISKKMSTCWLHIC